MEEAAVARRFAYATLVTSDSYVDGALVLLHSLRRTLTPFSIVCLATPSALSEHSLQRLRTHFDGVIVAELRQSDDDDNLSLLGRPDLRSTLTKIQLWDPALFGAWDAVCYLDADTLVRQPIDDVFSRYETWRAECPVWRQGGLVAAAPDTGWPDCFNSGVLLLAPGYDCYRDLASRTAAAGASFDGADQGLLNEHFSDWATASPYRRLPFLYNATANVYYTYRPALQRFGHEVRVVHFIGVSKPWHWDRTPGGQLLSDPSMPERWRQLVNLWWNIHDECVSGWTHWKGPFDKSVAFGRSYHHISSPPAATTAPVPDHGTGAHIDFYTGKLLPQTPVHDSGSANSQAAHEVPDWEKDWSWAADRVHPLDYSYLTTHASISTPHSHEDHHRQSHTPHYESQHDEPHHHHDHKQRHYDDYQESGRDDDRAHESADVHYHQQAATQHNHGDSGAGQPQKHDSHEGPAETNTEPHSWEHTATPPQQQQQAPVWMQSQRPWEDVAREGWMHHDDYKPHTYDQAYVARRMDHHGSDGPWHSPSREPEYVALPLPHSQALYEATQVVLQPRDSGNMHSHHYQPHYSHEDHVYNRPHTPQQHHGLPGDSYTGHHEHTYDSQGHSQTSDTRSNRGTAGSSPLHYPQPKSPMIVNPVALWESSEEQARRRAWAQQVRGPPDTQQESLTSTPTHHLPNVPWPSAAAPGADQRVPPSAMDQIDSSLLPRDTPWKVSHVRQRPPGDDMSAASLLPPHHMGMQFKEGVANDVNARDAAGQLLQRWNEAVIARSIRSHIGSMDPDQITHSIAKVERGTDAIRLETTVSCEAEDSKGERTVYRFTLSSTLDVGGAVPAPQAIPSVPAMQQEQPSALLPVHSAATKDSRASSDVTNLRQPPNYQEPAMSRRSSFVQLQQPPPATALRVPAAALRAAPDHSDQFAESDARYWRLQRQLIDLEMSQRRSETAVPAAPGGQSGIDNRSNGGWDDHQATLKLDLASPPTPTRSKPPPEFDHGVGRRLVRRPSAFSVADPQALALQETETESSVLPASNTAVASASAVAPDASPALVLADLASGRNRQRSSSSPRLPDKGARQHDQEPQPLAPSGSPSDLSVKKVSIGGAVSPSLSKRSRSYTALHRIATHNSAQAAVAPLLGAAGSKTPAQATVAGEAASTDSDDSTQEFKPATGRIPTPYPRDLLAKSKSTSRDVGQLTGHGASDGDIESGADISSVSPVVSAPGKRPALGLLKIEPRDNGFEPSSVNISPASAGTPLTPGRQKLRPKINWGDDEDNGVPSESDTSLDAQWLRIINGAPPSRAPVLSTGATTKQKQQSSDLAQEQSVVVADDVAAANDISGESAEASSEDAAIKDQGESDDSDSKDRLGADSAKLSPPESARIPAKPLASPAPGTRAPPRKLHSTRSFLNLTSREFDTLSDDSEVDVSEAALQARFWARAMKPAKSGNSSPYSPGRRKSVVEMSSAISPRDLEEWMQWQGDSAILDRQAPSEDSGTAGAGVASFGGGMDASMLTPPVSKGSVFKQEPLDAIQSTADYSCDGDVDDDYGSEDDALQMQQPQRATSSEMNQSSAKDAADARTAFVAAREQCGDAEHDDAGSDCDSCFGTVEYSAVVESNKSASASSSSLVPRTIR
ncbi:glycogenin glucosyltransferase [Coemansia sp. RSA 2320]|nr:glycogenin glucosyltransferase [Coemansia sp. RSA 2320]